MKRRHDNHRERLGSALSVSEFKARCLEIFETLRERGRELVVTRHGEPIARIVPLQQHEPLRGVFKDQVEIVSDIVQFDLGEEWEAAR